MTPPAQQPPPGKQLQVHVPPDLSPTYANLALITHSFSEIVIDFAQVMPQVAQARVKTRVVMTPTNAKLLMRALAGHLARYEESHGEIKIPQGTSLADQLFRGEPEPQEEEESDDD
jgi:hypothetical protein